jgi:adenylate kinase
MLQKKLGLIPIESGNIFRDNVKKQTDLGKKAQIFLQVGDLVPDDITIPMVLDCLQSVNSGSGWLLDGFPRNVPQAKKLWDALEKKNIAIDYVVEIKLDQAIAKKRIMGRRICVVNPGHSNNLYMEGFKPTQKNGSYFCQSCGALLTAREDDLNEPSIDKRHKIYYDDNHGTKAAVNWLKDHAQTLGAKTIVIDGEPNAQTVTHQLFEKLGVA